VIAGLSFVFLMLMIFGSTLLSRSAHRSSGTPAPRLPVTVAINGQDIALPPAVQALATDAAAETFAVSAPVGVDLSGLAGRRVLVVSDLGTPMNPAVREPLLRVLASLRDAGGLVMGDGAVLIDPLAADDPANVELVASVEAARGQRSLDANNLLTTMRRWLGEHDAIDVVVFLAPDRPASSGIEYALVTAAMWSHGHIDDAIDTELARSLADLADNL
jgi:hypothetical protein